MPSPFESLLKLWQDAGLVTSDAAIRMQQDWDAAVTGRARLKWTVFISTLGALLIGLAALIFIATNWYVLSGQVKILLTVLATFTSYTLGQGLAGARAGLQWTGRALIFLACLLFGATLVVISQVYHLSGAPYLLTGLWLLGIAPVVYLMRHNAVGALMAGLAFATLFLFINTAPGLELSDIFNPEVTLFELITATMLVSCLICAIGLVHLDTHWTATGRVFLALGASVYLLVLFKLTFPDIVENLLSQSWLRSHTPDILRRLTMVIAASYVLTLWALWRNPRIRARWITVLICVIVATFLGMFFMFITMHIKGPEGGFRALLPYWTFLANLAFAGFALTLHWLGRQWSAPWMLILGTISIMAFIIGKYIQFAPENMGVAAFYFVGGLIFLLSGIVLERLRKHDQSAEEMQP